MRDTYAGAQAPAREKQFDPVSFAKKKKEKGERMQMQWKMNKKNENNPCALNGNWWRHTEFLYSRLCYNSVDQVHASPIGGDKTVGQ